MTARLVVLVNERICNVNFEHMFRSDCLKKKLHVLKTFIYCDMYKSRRLPLIKRLDLQSLNYFENSSLFIGRVHWI